MSMLKRSEPESRGVWMSRVVFVVAIALAGYILSEDIAWMAEAGYSQEYTTFALVVLGAAIGYILGGMVGRELTRAFQDVCRRIVGLKPTVLVLGAVGLLAGLLAAFLISTSLFSYIMSPQWLGLVATIVLYVLCAYAGSSLFMLSGQQLAEHSFTAAPVAEEAPPKLLDTSAIIDGRFMGLARPGILEGPLRAPRFVLEELHTLADSEDEGRRSRGRRGLDLLATLRAGDEAVEVIEIDYPDFATVDAKLVRAAVQSTGTIVTVDHNLAEVARIQDVRVININQVAEALRPTLLPGDAISVLVTREGKEPGQGVGHLEDGTMVVVSEASKAVGTRLDTRVTSVLQTASGRMVFARRDDR